MVVVSPAPAELDANVVSVYFTKDALLANLPVVIFYGPSTTTNSTLNSSRIQAHVYTLAGFQSFPRLTISPTSPLYAAVNCLPEEKQGDEIFRALAVSLCKYFGEIPKNVKSSLVGMAAIGRPDSTAPAMFDEFHAGDLAGKMVKVDNTTEVANYIRSALSEKVLSWTDLDVILPPHSIGPRHLPDAQHSVLCSPEDVESSIDYGRYGNLIELFGSPTFLPSSRLKRAPSRPTAVNKSRTLDKDQKESIRREMSEFLATEERYVGKVYELVNNDIVHKYRHASLAASRDVAFEAKAIKALFPESIDRILRLNTAFTTCIRTVIAETEQEAMPDILNRADNTGNRAQGRSKSADTMGIETFAKALLEWFPQFREPYQEYLRASSAFPKTLNDLLRDSASSDCEWIQVVGEQRLRSWLIEPVQRLPRYSLFIDNLVNQLPAAHPAISKLLRAKDVVTDICSLDNDEPVDSTKTTERLKNLITAWPMTLSPSGRLVTAVDVAELKAPYRFPTSAKDGQASIMLLFRDSLVVIRKMNSNSLSARGILAELDRHVSTPASVFVDDGGGSDPTKHLSFAYSFDLQETRFLESDNGKILSTVCVRRSDFVDTTRPINSRQYYAITRAFALLGSYEGKAARFNEEVGRARIEQRFPEQMRDGAQWSLRSLSPHSGSLGILSAIFEDDYAADNGKYRTSHGRIKVSVDQVGNERRISASDRKDRAVEITIHISQLESDYYRLEFAGHGNFSSADNVSSQDFVAVFRKRLENLQRFHFQPQTLESAQAHISFHQKVVETLPLRVPVPINQTRRFRPVSPVKALSNFLGSSKDLASPAKPSAGPLSDDMPIMLPPTKMPSPPRHPQQHTDTLGHNKVTLINADQQDSKDSLAHLEATFNAYMVALRARSGNVVGKILRGRAAADELLVNELYNILVEDPTRIEAAAVVSVDVLFAAFETFLNKAWKQRMGSLVAPQVLENMQKAMDSSRIAQVVEHFKSLLSELGPQNRRAFTGMIKLLSDLLEASGNDGDRGALIATFAEAIVAAGNPHSYISLLDRLVEDYDILFEDSNQTEPPIANAQSDSWQRTRSINTGSLSSNASSIRKRFGFSALSRENSKTESESRVGQVWRNLSKKSSNEVDPQNSQASSLSKAFLSRSRSIDHDARKPLPPRPMSQDQPVPGSLLLEESRARPGSAHNALSNLTTIGEGGAETFTSIPRKKRRSSLSDLKDLRKSGIPSFGSPSQLRMSPSRESSVPPFQVARSSLRTPSPTKFHQPSSSLDASPKRFASPNRKENSPMPCNTLTERAVNRKSDEAVIKPLSLKKYGEGQTGIPLMQKGLHERVTSRNPPSLSPKKTASSPQKLRMQSPQKLRERLQNEKKAIEEAGPSLQAELSKIGDELSVLNLSRPGQRFVASDVTALSTRVKSLETKLASLVNDLTARSMSISSDIESSLTVSERKAKSLDELYREANAENEALYERFNDELGRVLKAVKGGQGVEEMRVKMKEAQDEAARLKKENARLKRENLGLRSQLRGD